MKLEKPKLNYLPRSMSFSEGFLGPKGDVGYMMRIDKEKAKKIVETLIKQKRKVEKATRLKTKIFWFMPKTGS